MNDKKTPLIERLKMAYENSILMNFTVMLVPHKSTKKPIHFNIPVGIIFGIFAALLILFSCTSFFAYNSYRLRLVQVENEQLNKISVKQEEELRTIELLAEEVLDKMNSLTDLEDDVRDKVGLEPAAKSGLGGVFDEYVFPVAKIEDGFLGDRVFSRRLAEASVRLDVLSSYADVNLANMNVLQNDVNERLLYLAALPTGLPILDATYASEFGPRIDPILTYRIAVHSGLDFIADYGTPIYASGNGTVLTAGDDGAYGTMVRINHGYGYQSIYAHCSRVVTRVGAQVKRGDIVGYVGSTGRSTGNHLHFTIQYNNEDIDPWPFLKEAYKNKPNKIVIRL